MRCLVWSDLHVDSFNFKPKLNPDNFDAIIIAGDVANKFQGYHFIEQMIRLYNKPIIMVLGNHEYYNNSKKNTYSIAEIQQYWISKKSDMFHPLIDEPLILDGHVFYGCTLWTSLNEGQFIEAPELHAYNDFRAIYTTTRNMGYKRLGGQVLTPTKYYTQHLYEHNGLFSFLDAYKGVNVTIITHHPPIKYIGPYDPTKPGSSLYYNNFEQLIADNPNIQYWVHGHDHHQRDFVVGNTAIVSNPRGYERSSVLAFDPERVILEVKKGQ